LIILINVGSPGTTEKHAFGLIEVNYPLDVSLFSYFGFAADISIMVGTLFFFFFIVSQLLSLGSDYFSTKS